MILKKTMFAAIILMVSLLGSGILEAEESPDRDSRFCLIGSYNAPYNSESFQTSFGIGAAFKFWGIFNLNAHLYTDIVTGGDNIFNIQAVEPLGLFSFGWGVKIPMATNMSVTGDLQKFYRGWGEGDEFYSFSSSWKAGVCVDINQYFGMEFYLRHLYDFSDEARNEADSLIAGLPEGENVKLIGVGLIFYL